MNHRQNRWFQSNCLSSVAAMYELDIE